MNNFAQLSAESPESHMAQIVPEEMNEAIDMQIASVPDPEPHDLGIRVPRSAIPEQERMAMRRNGRMWGKLYGKLNAILREVEPQIRLLREREEAVNNL